MIVIAFLSLVLLITLLPKDTKDSIWDATKTICMIILYILTAIVVISIGIVLLPFGLVYAIILLLLLII